MILFSRTALIDPEIQLSAQRLSTRFSFFGLGFATAAWAPLIPFAQQRLHFNHANFFWFVAIMQRLRCNASYAYNR